jgi:DNA repair exonuclease SbcCD ATPase subunit
MIRRLVLRNFRGHTRNLEFGPRLNVVKGRNEAGKTTIKEAIAFAWFGTDSYGKNPDHLISVGENITEVIIETAVVTLTRTKKRGKTAVIKMQQHGFPSVDLNQTELSAKLKLSIEAFMSCWNSGYFMTLPAAKQMAVLGEFAKIDRVALLQEQLGYAPPAQLKLDNLKVAADTVAGRRRQVQNIKASEEGALSQLKSQFGSLNEAETVDVESFQSRVNEINAVLADFDLYTKELARYRAQATQYDLNKKNIDSAREDLRKLEGEFAAIPGSVAQPVIEGYERTWKSCKAESDQLRTQVAQIPAAPKKLNLEGLLVCGTCGQEVHPEHAARVEHEYNNELARYNEQARQIQNQNDRLLARAAELEKQARAAHQDYVNAVEHNRKVEAEQKRVMATKDRCIAVLNGMPMEEPRAPKRPEGDEQALRKELLDLSTEINLARRKSTELSTVSGKITQLTAAIAEKSAEIENLARLEGAIQALPAIEVERTLQVVQVPGVTIRLADGELEILDEKGVVYQSLSSGRKMKVNSLICSSLRKFAGPAAPKWLFIDDTDLMDSFQGYIPDDLQTFVVKVVPNLDDVVVDIL